jgi:molybdopterin molybdotransferase
MTQVEEALGIVLSKPGDYGLATVPLQDACNRFLGNDIFADRDSPPFDRVMMDGIAIDSNVLPLNEPGYFLIESIQAAGDPQKVLFDKANCIEVMTGAILPANTDTVIPYENIEIIDDRAYIKQPIVPKKYIHFRGSDHKKDQLALHKCKLLNAADIGLLAAVGVDQVTVFKLPKVAIVATGNELVGVSETPESHQVRMSNVYSLEASLKMDKITSDIFHFVDDEEILFTKLSAIIKEYDVILISGGVSKGKYDHVPAILDKLGVQKLFHQVAQRPGKPFWFGVHQQLKATVFAFPGNPVSTFVCYQYYFRQWLFSSFGNQLKLPLMVLSDEIMPNNTLSQFIPVVLNSDGNELNVVINNGSGDLFSLSAIDGFIFLPKGDTAYPKQSSFYFLKIS